MITIVTANWSRVKTEIGCAYANEGSFVAAEVKIN